MNSRLVTPAKIIKMFDSLRLFHCFNKSNLPFLLKNPKRVHNPRVHVKNIEKSLWLFKTSAFTLSPSLPRFKGFNPHIFVFPLVLHCSRAIYQIPCFLFPPLSISLTFISHARGKQKFYLAPCVFRNPLLQFF